jgi:RNA polymerase sigma-70 factor (ECF subfamily)
MAAPQHTPELAASDDAASTFINARGRILAAALHTLGNVAEAEDVAQDVWLRWQGIDRELVRNVPAFLTTISRRLALNRAMGARSRLETPLELRRVEPADPDSEPGTLAERGEQLAVALSLLLARLSPAERAAFLLREAFNYSYRRIAEVVHVSEVNSRQLVTRARKRLARDRRGSARSSELRRFAVVFIDATRKGDLAGLEAALCADIADQ